MIRKLISLVACVVGLAAPAVVCAQPVPVPAPADVENIGHALTDAAGTSEAKFLLYALFDDSNSITTIRFVQDGSPEIRPLFLPNGAVDLGRIWRDAGSPDGPVEMIYVLDHGKLKITLLYADQFPPGTTSRERMEAAVRQHLDDGR